jgi:hypothetical protein
MLAAYERVDIDEGAARGSIAAAENLNLRAVEAGLQAAECGPRLP